MEEEFEKYMGQNRDQFEKGSPSPDLWDKIEQQLILHTARKARIVKIQRIAWSIAASLLLLGSVGLLIVNKQHGATQITNISPKIHTGQNIAKEIPKIKNGDTIDAKKEIDLKTSTSPSRKNSAYELTGDEYRQSIFYYSRLVEIRQRQIRRLQSSDPDLYKECQKALLDLSDAYSQLRNQLPSSINRQKVLESMIENLQLQEKILGNQLQIIREAQSTSNHEKSVKEI